MRLKVSNFKPAARAATLLLIVLLTACQDLLLFRVPLLPAPLIGMPDVTSIAIPTPDGEVLDGWYAPPRSGMPLVLFFPGNKGRESRHRAVVNQIHAAGYGLLLAAYRGYPPSTGTASESGLYADGLALFDFAAEKCSCRILVLGHSLGSGVGVHTAALRPASALLLVSPYSSIAEVAAFRLRKTPLRKPGKFAFRAEDWIGKVNAPVFILHGVMDTTIPIRFAEKLFDAARQPKRFIRFAEAGHELLWTESLVPWLDTLMKASLP